MAGKTTRNTTVRDEQMEPPEINDTAEGNAALATRPTQTAVEMFGHPSTKFPTRDNLDLVSLLNDVDTDRTTLDALFDAKEEDFAEHQETLMKFPKDGDEQRGIYLGRTWMPTDGANGTGLDDDGQPSGLVEAWFAVRTDGGDVIPRKIHQTVIQGAALDVYRVGTPLRIKRLMETRHGPAGTLALLHFAIQPLRKEALAKAQKTNQERNAKRGESRKGAEK